MGRELSTSSVSLADTILAAHFGMRGSELAIGGFGVTELAKTYGTPLYIYDGALMRRTYSELSRVVSGFAQVYYSIKANPNQRIVRLFVEEGAGLEVASGEEFRRAVAAGCKPSHIVFAGPAKGANELALVVEGGIGEIHVETFAEIDQLGNIGAHLNRKVRVAVRVNPVSAARGGAMQMGGRPSPFGFDEEDLEAAITAVQRHRALRLSGVHVFSGTQILEAGILHTQWAHSIDIAAKVAQWVGAPLETIDLGGGLGVPYHSGEKPLDLASFADFIPSLQGRLRANPLLKDARVILEPGRFLCAGAGIYLMSVRAEKISRKTRFVICDGGMHHHLAASGNLGQVVKRDYPIVAASRISEQGTPCTLVGPLCTPLDTLGRSIILPRLQAGDLVAILQSGAYGLTASPTGFLSHPTPAEVLVERGRHQLIRKSEANLPQAL
jgi:diaminopimelate decarboxylase